MDREILSIVLILVFVFLVILTVVLNNSRKIDDSVRRRIWGDVLNIDRMVKTKNPLVYRDIIIRLDSLLSKSLQLYFKNTDSCGENLKRAKNLFNRDEYNKLWEAHKLRNKVVHENEEISTSQIRDSYNIMSNSIKKILYEK